VSSLGPRLALAALLVAALFTTLSVPGPALASERFSPKISGTPVTSVQAGNAYAFAPTVSSQWNEHTFSIVNQPAWSTFSTTTGELSGTPSSANVGSYSGITISVSERSGTASLAPFTITVTSPAPPTITGTPATTVQALQAYSFTPAAASPRGAALTFSIANMASWASFSTTTGQLSGTPGAANVGSFANITISVNDGTASASLAPFTITVTSPAPPTITGTPATTVTAGSAYSFTPAASSPRGAALTFSIANMPSWAAFSTSTGKLSGTPTSSNVGTFANITISVNDGTASASLAPFTITVTAATPPSISGTPATSVTAGQAYSFTPTASSPRGGTLTFSIANMPSWASFSTTTGQLSGMPTSANAGTFANITISVNDGTASASLAPFTITVTAAAPPTISGTPSTSVTAGSAYSFTPTTTNASGGTLTFSISNMPSWASFSSSTGQLSGTPTSANVGTYANITISVSNGTASASLALFTITVQAGTTGSATLSWTAPTTRTDGSPLTNLAGYNIYYGTTQGTYPNTIAVTNPSLTTYVVTNLQAGVTYYFVIAAYDATGLESAYTNVGSTTIP